MKSQSVRKKEGMEEELKAASREEEKKDEQDDGSSPEARDQGEKERSDAADIVTTGLGEMSLGDSKKEEEGKDVIPSQDFNLSSDGERYQSTSMDEPDISEKRSEGSGSFLLPHYSPHSNVISSRTITDSGLQKEKDDAGELERRDQECSFHSGTLLSREQKSSDGKEENIRQDLGSGGQSFETVDRSADTNFNDLEQAVELRMKQRVSITSSNGK